MKLYLTRHGQTEWNAQDKVCGITDVGLTKLGIKQADELAEKLKDKGIDIILHSPLKRAVQTASRVAEKCNACMIPEGRLTEQNYGIYEGVDRRDEGFLNNKRQFAYRYPGGESMMDVAYRTYQLLDEIKEKYSDNTVLIVCHNGVCRVINTYFNDITNQDFFEYSLENCEVKEYEY